MTARDLIQLTFPEVLGWFKSVPKPVGSQGRLSAERLSAMEVEAKSYEYSARRLRARIEGQRPHLVAAPVVAAPAAGGGNSGEALVKRKFTAGLSDLQVLCLFALAKQDLLTLSDLAETLGVGASAAWHAAEKMIAAGYIVKETLNKPFSVAYFYLHDDGKRKVAWLLGKS